MDSNRLTATAAQNLPWTRPQWQDRCFGGDYHVTFLMAGDRIIIGQPEGKSTPGPLEQALDLMDEIVDSQVPSGRKVIFIEDYSRLESASLESRRYYIRRVGANPRICALVFCGVTAFFRLSIKLGQKLTTLPFPVRICDTLAEALAQAQALVESDTNPSCRHRPPQGFADEAMVRQQPDWSIDQDGFSRADITTGPRPSRWWSRLLSRRAVPAAGLPSQLDALLEYIGRIDMEKDDGLDPAPRPMVDPVFSPIFDAIDLFTSELRHLLGERQTAEHVLRESEQRYRTIVEGIAVGYFELDSNGRMVFCNPALGPMLGYARDELFALNKTAVMGSDAVSALENACKTHLPNDGAALVSELDMRRKDGAVIHVEATVSPIRQADGRPGGIRGILRDVTQRKREEALIRENTAILESTVQRRGEALRRSEEKSRAIIENIEEGYFEVDLAGNFTFHNEILSQMLGCHGQPMLGHNFRTVIRGQEAQALHDAFHHVFATGQPLRQHGAAVLTHDERICHLETSVSLIRDEKGQPQGFRGIVHEIRTPLNGIIGMTELIRMERLDEENRDFFQTISDQSAMLLDIVNGVLDFSKIEAGKMALEALPIDLNGLLHHMAASLAVQAHAKGLELETDFVPIPVALRGDPTRLRQVINNLAANAIKFTPRGHVRLSCRRLAETKTRLTLRFVVADTGIGIPADKLDGIFDSFTQADDSTTRNYGGTGLGTAIAKQLVELMGGRIWVNSRPGQGSTFWFEVGFEKTGEPAGQPHAAVGGGFCAATEPARRPTTGQPSRRILLVEDYATNKQVAWCHLTRGGHRVDLAENGAEAVNRFQTTRYDLILMDVQMPVMDGYEATGRIRALEGDGRRTPIIALTGHTAKSDIDRCLAAGMDGYLTKPLRKSLLLALVARWTGPADPPPLSPAAPTEPVTVGAAPPLDRALALAEFENDADFFNSVLDGYIRQVPTQINAIRQALAGGDADHVWQQAHAIKGGAANLAAGDLAAAALALENAGRNGHLAESADLLNDIEAQYRRLKAWEANGRAVGCQTRPF